MIKELKFDKSSWKTVRFGDVVTEPRDTISDLADSGIERIVGLEHIDSESLHLRRSAGIEESTTFTKKFSSGDVLFGRRRAYLKKAAQAPFDGICSGDITVMRVKNDLLSDLLPFIVNNDKFFDFAIKHSAGGLSPRVKFKDLANYEFLLPPKPQQAELAELLWAMDTVIEKAYSTLNKNEILHKTMRESECFVLNDGSKLKYNNTLKTHVNCGIEYRSLEQSLTAIKYGTSKKGNNEKKGIQVIGIPNVVNETLNLDGCNYVELSENRPVAIV